MRYSSSFLVAAFAVTNVFAHGDVSSTQGTHGVDMPELSVTHSTPKDVAFSHSAKAMKRAVEYNLHKRNFARALVNRRKPDSVSDALAALEATGSATKAEDGVDEVDEKSLTKRQQDEAAAAIQALKDMGSATEPEDDEETDGSKQEAKKAAAEEKQKRELSVRERLSKEEEIEQAKIDKETEEEDRE